MRKLIVSEFVTLDGVMQGPGGAEEDTSGGFDKGGWTSPFSNEESGHYKVEELFATGAILIGRRTYDIFAGYWPTQTDAEGNPFPGRMNSLPKYVVSTTLDKAEWQNSHVIKGDVTKQIADLKRESGQDILVYGSADLVQTLIKEGLVDELRLMVFPIVLGKGKRIFQDGLDAMLEHVDTKTFATGVVVLIYKPKES